MSSTLSLILRDNRIRIPAVTLVALAFTYTSTAPYQSIIGINELNLSNGTYSAFVFFSAIVSFVRLPRNIEEGKHV
ncbi:hypothetical protein ACVI1T_002216 [Rhizobium redzepovicii]